LGDLVEGAYAPYATGTDYIPFRAISDVKDPVQDGRTIFAEGSIGRVHQYFFRPIPVKSISVREPIVYILSGIVAGTLPK